MGKLSQLCAYLERPDATELVFEVGAPAVVKSTTRDLPVTVSPLNQRAVSKFFEGTDVAALLAGGDKSKDVRFELEGKSLVAAITKRGMALRVSVRMRSLGHANEITRPLPAAPTRPQPAATIEPRSTPRASPPAPAAAPTTRTKPRTVDLPPLGGPEMGLPSAAVAPTRSDKMRAREADAPVRLAPEPTVALAPTAPPPSPTAAKGLGARLAPVHLRASGVPELESMLRQMIELGASDLHLSADSRPIVRLHGSMQPLEGHRTISADRLAQLLLELADDDTYRSFVEHADADFAYAIKGLARFRANYFADRKGMGAVFRQIPMDILTPEAIGLPTKVLDLCWLTKGLVLVTGPTGSGKSTTLASMVDFINRNRDDHIITIEDPIEFVHDNKRCLVNQREVGRHTRSFKAALRAALREDPDVILVGELRDLETIHIALETAETGHLVFGTLHTTTAPSTVDRLIDQFPGDQQAQIRTMLGESMRGVIGQTLLRRKTGGRVAAYEVLLHTSAVGNLIREGKTHQLKNTMQVSKDIGMQNLNDHMMKLVLGDVIEPREAYLKAVDKKNLQQMFEKAGIQFEATEE